MVRNLGAPVPDEHGEYWKNQEEFVPLLGRAVDPELPWLSNALDDTRPRQWTLTRLGMLSAITRVRFTLVAAAVSAAVIFAAGFVSDTSNMFDYVADRGHSWFGAELLSLDCRDGLGTCNEDGFSLDVVQAMHEEDWLANAVGLGVLLFLSYVAMTVYTNMFWGPLARGGLPFGRIGQLQIGPPGWVFPWRDVLRMEIPTVLVPLAPIAVGLREPVFWIVLAVSAVMALLEVVWLSLCYLALRSDATGVFRGFGAAVGRGQDQKSAPLPTIEKSRVAT
jgi:hypothetical protein